jgi:hypothetical protein
MQVLKYLPYSCLLYCILFTACLEIQAEDDQEMMTINTLEMGPPPLIEVNDQVLNSSLLMRILPAQLIGEAQIFCEAVAITSTLLLSTAYCFRQGASFAEVFTGEQIDITNPSQPSIPVKAYYLNEMFQDSMPMTFQSNIALIELVGNTNSSILRPLANIEDANLESFVRVGYENIDSRNFRRFVQVMLPIGIQINEIIFGNPNADLCPMGGGATVAKYNDDIMLVALNHRSNMVPCASSGSALRVDLHQEWIESSVTQLSTNIIGNNLQCAQALLCYTPSCNQALKESHRSLYDRLFLCANESQCTSVDCYPTVCPQEYQDCVSAQ